MSASREKKIRQELAAQGIPDIKEIRAAEERKAQRRTNILYGSLAAAFVLVAAALLVWNSGILQRDSVAMSVDGEKYTSAEVSYYYNSAVNSLLSSSYGSYYSINTSLPMDQQKVGDFDAMLLGITLEEGKEMTWHQFFLDQTKKTLIQQTALLRAADKAGFQFNDEMKAELDSTMELLETYAKQSGSTPAAYLKGVYGSSMTESVFKKELKNTILTSYFQNDYIEKLEYSADDIQKYYGENAEMFDNVSYEYITFDGTAESKKDAEGNTVSPTEEEEKAAKAAAKANAEAALARYQAGESLEKIAKDFEKANYYNQPNGVNSGGKLQEWLYDDARAEGDKAVLENGSSYYVVGFRSRWLDEYLTVNVRHILCKIDDSKLDSKAEDYKTKRQELIDAAKAEADAILNEWKSGAKTSESFAELAKAKTDDTGSKETGGLYENIPQGQMVPEFDEWIFETGRQVGDTDIIFVDQEGYYTGYHVMYFDGYSDPYWELMAESYMLERDYNSWMDGLVKDLTAEEHSGIKYVG